MKRLEYVHGGKHQEGLSSAEEAKQVRVRHLPGPKGGDVIAEHETTQDSLDTSLCRAEKHCRSAGQGERCTKAPSGDVRHTTGQISLTCKLRCQKDLTMRMIP